MKKIFSAAALLVLAISLLALNVTPGRAQTEQPASPTPSATLPPPADQVSFATLVGKDILLRGPYATSEVRYMPPLSWQVQPGANLVLNVDASFSSQENFGQRGFGASLEVTINEETAATLYINQNGPQTFTIPLPEKALNSLRPDGRNSVRFFLDAAYDCSFPQETTILLKSSSFLYLPHTLIAPSTNLAVLPRPFYQQDSFLPEQTLLLTADSPSAKELQAALTVSAAFGRMSQGELLLPLVTVSALTEEQRAQSHLIVVGTDALLQSLPEVILAQVALQPGDGRLQMTISPWNPERSLLFVGGDEDGVLKAAQALTFGAVQPGVNLSSAVISAISPQTASDQTPVDRSFADLGYASRTVTGYGVNSMEFRFYVPAGFVPGSDPFINLVYSHSALMDLSNSGLVILLNDQRIGSLQFTAETARQQNAFKIALQPEALRPGDNRLVLQVDMRPTNLCSDFTTNGLWFTISPASLIHLPLVPAQAGQGSLLTNLNLFPYPFTSTPSLNGLTMIVAPQDPAAWNAASQISALLGRRATGKILTPGLAFADAIPPEARETSLLLIGRPADLPVLAEMSAAMPAPFEPGSNLALERSFPVTYRLPESAALGYVELFASPFNPEKSVIAFLGGTPEALNWTLAALTDPNLRSKLTGNYAVINQQQILAADTRLGESSNLSATAWPGSTPTTPVAAPAPAQAQTRPNWMFPVILVSSLGMLGLLLYVALSSRRR